MNFKLTLDSNVDLQCNGGAIASTVVSLALAHVSSTPLRIVCPNPILCTY